MQEESLACYYFKFLSFYSCALIIVVSILLILSSKSRLFAYSYILNLYIVFRSYSFSFREF